MTDSESHVREIDLHAERAERIVGTIFRAGIAFALGLVILFSGYVIGRSSVTTPVVRAPVIPSGDHVTVTP